MRQQAGSDDTGSLWPSLWQSSWQEPTRRKAIWEYVWKVARILLRNEEGDIFFVRETKRFSPVSVFWLVFFRHEVKSCMGSLSKDRWPLVDLHEEKQVKNRLRTSFPLRWSTRELSFRRRTVPLSWWRASFYIDKSLCWCYKLLGKLTMKFAVME